MSSQKFVSIPKIIHLCWFSGDEYPEGIKECLDSWKRVIPDYQVKLWTKDMALATNIPFVKEAIEKRKWAFAADVIRLYALYHDGGVYADSDIYLISRFDEYLTDELVLFHEYARPHFNKNPKTMFDADGHNLMKGHVVKGLNIQAAFMISSGHHPLVKELLDYYCKRSFIREDGSLEMDIIAPEIYAMVMEDWGYRYKNEKQVLFDGITVYPAECVGGNNCMRFKESFAVHCVSHSWKPSTPKERIFFNLNKAIKKILFMKDKATVKSFVKY